MTVRFVLIHGTFARRAEWLERTSKLSHALAEAFPDAELIPFRWTDLNSHSARYRGGRRLAEKIGPALQPGDRLYLIGHSHGGNVALHALRDPSVRQATAGMVFLGTPFLHARLRNASVLSELYASLVAWLFIPLSAMMVPLLVPGMFALLAITFPAVVVYAWFYSRTFQDRLAVRLKRWLAEGALLANARIRFPIPPCPTFVSSIGGDEAGLWLKFVDRITLTPWSLLVLAGQIGVSTLFGMWLSIPIAALFGLPNIAGEHESLVTGVLVVAMVGMVGFVLVGPPLLLAISWLRGSAKVYGGEPLSMVAATHVAARPDPPWIDSPLGRRHTVYPPEPLSLPARLRKGRLYHSLFYDNDEVIGAILDWMRVVEAAPGRDHARAISLPEAGRRVGAGCLAWAVPGLIVCILLTSAAILST